MPVNPLDTVLSQLLLEVEAGHTVVTSTQRLARDLQQQLTDRFINSERLVWPTPDIVTWSVWIERCYERVTRDEDDAPLMLTSLQSAAVWEQVVGDDLRSDQAHVSARLIARTASHARQLLFEWQINSQDNTHDGLDAQRFLSWHQRYRQTLDESNWIDQAVAVDAILSRLAHASSATASPSVATSSPHSTVYIAGFDRFTPQQQRFIESIKQQQIVEIVAPSATNNVVEKIICSDRQEELTHAARWARRCCEAWRESNTDGQPPRVAIVVPDIANQRDTIERIMLSVIDSDAVGFSHDRESGFHISLGPPLARQPVVAAALLALQCLRPTISLQSLGALLRSPYLSQAKTEYSQRATFDALLRRLGLLRFPVAEIVDQCQQSGVTAPHWCKAIDAVTQLEIPRRASARHWAELFQQCLACLGWPGERGLDSHEYQAVQSWRECLQQFSATSLVRQRLTLNSAIATLTGQVRDRAFAAQAPDFAIDVLGLQEASGLEFSHVWLTGMNDHIWPPQPMANAFVPFHRQREAGVPDADPAAMRAYAETVYNRIKTSAQHLVVSYSSADEDRELRPSMLISQVPAVEHHESQRSPVVARHEQLFDNGMTPLTAKPDRSIVSVNKALEVGGTGLFKAQSQCAFQAAARYRLNLTPLEPLTSGLTALERGSLVHRVMECVWLLIKSHANLLSFDEAAINQAVTTALDRVFAEKRAQGDRRYTDAVCELEWRRLHHNIVVLLGLERDREPFNVVATEEKFTATAGGITFAFRPDRIDQLDTGERLVIDYKSGNVTLSDWVGDRPFDPQLPLYALVLGDDIRALSFVTLRSGSVNFVGLAADESPAKGINPIAKSTRNAELKTLPDWDALRTYWQERIDRIGAEFLAGQADVAPLNNRVCAFCEFQPLCRIDDAKAASDDDFMESIE